MEHSLRLLVVDPDLASAIKDPARRRSALRTVTAGQLDLVRGEQFDPTEVAPQAPFGIVVLSGFLLRELTTDSGRASAVLFGPEDLVQLGGPAPEVGMLQHTVSWTAITDVGLALLDDDFFARAAPWPEVAGGLLERAGRLGQRLALRGAIATLQTVDARLLASFWTWASQWATVARQGMVLDVPLSHERLARLVHSRRPTVTTAMGRLRRAGLIAQRRDGSWMLRGPRAQGEGPEAWNGVTMPALGDMLSRRFGVEPKAPGGRRGDERETLRATAERLEQMLEEIRQLADVN